MYLTTNLEYRMYPCSVSVVEKLQSIRHRDVVSHILTIMKVHLGRPVALILTTERRSQRRARPPAVRSTDRPVAPRRGCDHCERDVQRAPVLSTRRARPATGTNYCFRRVADHSRPD